MVSKGKKILVMGLSGSGKTFLVRSLVRTAEKYSIKTWNINSDSHRLQSRNYGFDRQSRIENAKQMNAAGELAARVFDVEYTIYDTIAPLKEQRDIYNADFLIWMDTIKESKFKDTDAIFEPPENYNLRITEKDPNLNIDKIWTMILLF